MYISFVHNHTLGGNSAFFKPRITYTRTHTDIDIRRRVCEGRPAAAGGRGGRGRSAQPAIQGKEETGMQIYIFIYIPSMGMDHAKVVLPSANWSLRRALKTRGRDGCTHIPSIDFDCYHHVDQNEHLLSSFVGAGLPLPGLGKRRGDAPGQPPDATVSPTLYP